MNSVTASVNAQLGEAASAAAAQAVTASATLAQSLVEIDATVSTAMGEMDARITAAASRATTVQATSAAAITSALSRSAIAQAASISTITAAVAGKADAQPKVWTHRACVIFPCLKGVHQSTTLRISLPQSHGRERGEGMLGQPAVKVAQLVSCKRERGEGTVTVLCHSCSPPSLFSSFLLCSSHSFSARCGSAVAATASALAGNGTASAVSSTTLAVATCAKQATSALPLSVLGSSASTSVRLLI